MLATSISHHTALVYVMVLIAGADSDMKDTELRMIGEIVSHLPVFADYDAAQLTKDAGNCAELLAQDDGLEQALAAIETAIPEKLKETAYAMACDVAAADQLVTQEEARVLELLRYRLPVGRLPAAAIERGARARFMRL